MSDDERDHLAVERAAARFGEFLEFLSDQGFSQTQVAAQAGVPPQYLSDIKRGRRPVTELVARRLEDAFDVNFQWLLGTSDSREADSSLGGPIGPKRILTLPIFSHPIEGEPRLHPKWDGTVFELSGPALAKIAVARQPYVLRFGHDDFEGRLRRGDLILISQSPCPEAEVHVVRHKPRSYLARKTPQGNFLRIANGQELPGDSWITGHAVGILWGLMLKASS